MTDLLALADRVEKLTAPELIAEYRAAYRDTNKCEPPYLIYKLGWFRLGHPSTAYRRRHIQQMITALRARAKAAEGSAES